MQQPVGLQQHRRLQPCAAIHRRKIFIHSIPKEVVRRDEGEGVGEAAEGKQTPLKSKLLFNHHRVFVFRTSLQ